MERVWCALLIVVAVVLALMVRRSFEGGKFDKKGNKTQDIKNTLQSKITGLMSEINIPTTNEKSFQVSSWDIIRIFNKTRRANVNGIKYYPTQLLCDKDVNVDMAVGMAPAYIEDCSDKKTFDELIKKLKESNTNLDTLNKYLPNDNHKSKKMIDEVIKKMQEYLVINKLYDSNLIQSLEAEKAAAWINKYA